MKQTNERLCALAQKGDAAALDSLIDINIYILSLNISTKITGGFFQSTV